MTGASQTKNLVMGTVGALAGGVAGYFVFIFIARFGFYALMIPGAFVGVGSSMLAKDRSTVRSIMCAVIGLVVGLFSEWRFAPFIADSSLGYFITHAHQLRLVTLLMIAGGTALGYWFSVGKER